MPLEQHELTLIARLAALEALTVVLARGVAAAAPSFATALQQKAASLRELLAVRFQGFPEYSDLLSAETQEAWDWLLQQVLRPTD